MQLDFGNGNVASIGNNLSQSGNAPYNINGQGYSSYGDYSAALRKQGVTNGGTGLGGGELSSTYANLGNSVNGIIAPLRSAAQNTINYNTSLGTQAANSAANEYASRAAQSGGSALGAGVVKAQSLLPIFAQNATARQEEANTEAGYKMQGLNLQAQVATSLGQLRNQYANTLANYLTAQRGQNLSASAQQTGSGLDAAKLILGQHPPSATYTTDAITGQVSGGQDSLNAFNAANQQRQAASSYLASQLNGTGGYNSNTALSSLNTGGGAIPSWLQVRF